MAALNGADTGLGLDVTEFLRKQNPVLAGVLVLGGSMLTGLLLGSISIWVLNKAGYRPAEPASRPSGYDGADSPDLFF
jgi:hypothetical protein